MKLTTTHKILIGAGGLLAIAAVYFTMKGKRSEDISDAERIVEGDGTKTNLKGFIKKGKVLARPVRVVAQMDSSGRMTDTFTEVIAPIVRMRRPTDVNGNVTNMAKRLML